MSKKLKKHASLRGVSEANDAATQLSWFHIRTEECQDCTFSLLPRLSEQPLAQSTRVAFTMAEILLSLTIIGVVAAITLPSLMANINERTWNTQRKALYARMSQAIAMMPQVGGYGTLTEDESGSVTADTAAETFLTEGLSKVLKINNICDSDHLADCGVPTSYTNMAGSIKTWPKTIAAWNDQFVGFNVSYNWGRYVYSQVNTKAAAFETLSGETVTLYYNPNCSSENLNGQYLQPKMCANFIYDLNGNKGPNAVGKDIGFITALYPNSTSVVAPYPLTSSVRNNEVMTQQDAIAACTSVDTESRIPNFDELAAMYYNIELLGGELESAHWTGTITSIDKAWAIGFYAGDFAENSRSNLHSVWCIKR